MFVLMELVDRARAKGLVDDVAAAVLDPKADEPEGCPNNDMGAV